MSKVQHHLLSMFTRATCHFTELYKHEVQLKHYFTGQRACVKGAPVLQNPL